MTQHFKALISLFILHSTCTIALGFVETEKSRQLGLEDFRRTEEYYQECLSIKSLVILGAYKADCYTNYHHFNSDASRYYEGKGGKSWIEMSAFNLWHPGAKSTTYKDYELVAKMMNSYDLVAALELLPSVGRDYEHNQRVRKFVDETPAVIAELEERYSQSPRENIAERLERLRSDLKVAPTLYRLPDYLVLLNELRKLDPSWALILAPSGEAADEGFVQEIVGFFYRGRSVRPKVNEHCERFKKKRHGISFACYPKLTNSWLGKSAREVFSRRPFLGSFESGDFDFTLITSHIVFRAPADEGGMERVLMPSFGVKDYLELGPGANSRNYARLAEMKIITEIMERLRAESNEKDVIFLGDTNLEYNNEQWSKILESFPGGELFVDGPTTLTMPLQLSDGSFTNGVASDYDHIIMDTTETNECLKSNGQLSPRIGNFLQGNLKKLIHKRYLYRKPGVLEADPLAEQKRANLLSKFREKLEKRLTIKRNKVVVDDLEIEDTMREFDERVFLSQLTSDNYYRFYKEVISDHFPIYFSCKR
ncbi:MAG: hypothetical protein K9K67_11830 [Bacteriovoracaceae bacterium]|nr:hypothetical protein [Bacteriovoracaceae bacterium]